MRGLQFAADGGIYWDIPAVSHPCTFGCWHRPRVVAPAASLGFAVCVTTPAGAVSSFHLAAGINPAGRPMWRGADDNNGLTGAAGNNWVLGAWRLVGVTWDSGLESHIIIGAGINAVNQQEGSAVDLTGVNMTRFCVAGRLNSAGQTQVGSGYYDGDVAEPWLIRRVLTAAEVGDLNSGIRSPTDLAGQNDLAFYVPNLDSFNGTNAPRNWFGGEVAVLRGVIPVVGSTLTPSHNFPEF